MHPQKRPRLRTIAKAMFVIPFLVTLLGFAPVAVYTGEDPFVAALAMALFCYVVMYTYGLVLFLVGWAFNLRAVSFYLVISLLPAAFGSLALLDSMEHLDIILATWVFIPLLLLGVWAAAIGQTDDRPVQARPGRRNEKPAFSLRMPASEGILPRRSAERSQSTTRTTNSSPTVQRRRGRD
jgi:hypothetical protein